MGDFYYLYDPADNLALGQAIHLANTDGGMSYIVPFVNKNGITDSNDPASVALGAINNNIDHGQLKGGDPVSNRITAATAESLVGTGGWNAIKAMVKASIAQGAPAGWTEASLDAAATTYSVISSKGYSELQSKIFTDGSWHRADTSPDTDRGNPFVAYGGVITDSVFVDFAGHFVQTPDCIGQIRLSADGALNRGQIYVDSQRDTILSIDSNDPVTGLKIDAPGKEVVVANFSATNQGFGRELAALDDLAYTDSPTKALAKPLEIAGGDVRFVGDLVIDQVTQVFNGTTPFSAAIDISGAASRVVFQDASVYLGAVRGYDSLINVATGASLGFHDSTIYGFSTSSSNAGRIFYGGLDWVGFDSSSGSGTTKHLIKIGGGGTLLLEDTTFLREEFWEPGGEFGEIFSAPGKNANWKLNDYKGIADGDVLVASGGNLTLKDSTILASIRALNGAGTVNVTGSVIAGSPLGQQLGQSLVQLEGGVNTIADSLIDSLDARLLGSGSLSTSSTTHILASATPWAVSTTSDTAYTSLASFAGSSSVTPLSAWGDKDQAATQNKVGFQFYGPQAAIVTPSGIARTMGVQLSEAALPKVGSNGAVTYSLTARFEEAVKGFDSSDLQKALGTSAVAAGWQVSVAPFTRDAGRSWNFQLQSPVSFSAPVSLQLATGAAQSTLVTFPSSLESSASNSISLVPVAGVGSGASLRLSSDGLGFVVDGVAGSGLWLKLDALAANASWQNSLELTTRDGVQLGAVGATPNSISLGTKELYLAAGQELRFSQSSRNNPSIPTPATQISADAAGFLLRLDDGGGNVDRDFNDLDLRITSSTSASDLNAIAIARLQTNSSTALLDLTSIAPGGARFNVSITTDCADNNRLGFVKLDPLIGGGYSVAGVAASNGDAFRNAVRDNIINPGGTPLQVSGKASRTVTWDLTASDAGTYAPVLINQSGQVFTFGASAADGQTHCKVLGDNNFGFEDVLASQGPDWDYNDVKVKVFSA